MQQHRFSLLHQSEKIVMASNGYRSVIVGLLICLFCMCWIIPLHAFSAEDTNSVWTRPTYEKKMFEIGEHLLSANNIRTPILFRMSENTADLDATAEKDHHIITVGSALFPMVRSDDEMAAVLSHEIAHIISGQSGHFSGLSVFDILGTVIFIPDALDTTASLEKSLKQRIGRTVVQNKESEMDLIGLDLMVKAGYNPTAMETILDEIANDTGNKHWRSRVTLSDRIKHIHETIAEKYPQYLPSTDLKSPTLITDPNTVHVPSNKAEEIYQMNVTTDAPNGRVQQTLPTRSPSYEDAGNIKSMP